MFVNNDSNPVALSISLVKALLKLVGFAPAAAMLEGGQDLYQLLTDTFQRQPWQSECGDDPLTKQRNARGNRSDRS